MTNFIPIFPIDYVIYPNEIFRLHIDNDNYKQLITDCYGENKPFGMVPIRDKQLSEIGTLVEISDVVEVWEDSRMNILVKGKEIFKTLELIKSIPNKLYWGAIVNYPDNIVQPNTILNKKIISMLKDFHHLISMQPNMEKEEHAIVSYDLAHLVGLSYKEEIELLELLQESQRLEYIRRHLKKIIPMLTHIQKMMKRISQKNDFKKGKGFDLDINP